MTPPIIEPPAMADRGRPIDMRRQDEHHRRHQVDQSGQHILERVEPLQRVGEKQGKEAHQEHPLGRTEIASVDRRREREQPQRKRHLLGCGSAVDRRPAGNRGTKGHEKDRQNDEDGHHGLEHAGGKNEKQDGANDGAWQRGRRHREGAPRLALQFSPVAVGAHERAGKQAHGVGNVGRHRRQADRKQHREGDERA